MLATDGVWEVMTCQEVAHFVQRWRKRPWAGWSASDALTLEAQERWKLLQPEVRSVPAPFVFLLVDACLLMILKGSNGSSTNEEGGFMGSQTSWAFCPSISVWALFVLDKICTF